MNHDDAELYRALVDAARQGPRCALATDRCRSAAPPMIDAGRGHLVACWEAKP